MADHFTQFSCLFDVMTPEQAKRALHIYDAFQAELESDGQSVGFVVSILFDDEKGSILWIRDNGSGDPEQVVRFVERCAEEFSLTGRWGFAFANTCSTQRLDSFGGGALSLDLAQPKSIDSMTTDTWLAAIKSHARKEWEGRNATCH